MATVRLQKLIAEAGIASRRAAERLIAQGRVTVNGAIVREPGAGAEPGWDDVRVDGRPVHAPAAKTYLLLHKPRGYVTSAHDSHAEHTVMDLLPPATPRVYPVGRLDRESEGLLLLTDDGALTERLLHPRYGVEREYAVLVRGEPTPAALDAVRAGVEVEGMRVAPASAGIGPPPTPGDRPPPGMRWLRVVLREGRKREVRVICAAAGIDVLRLVRVRVGPLVLAGLAEGQARALTAAELAALGVAASPVSPIVPLGASHARRDAPDPV